ncbi:glycosyl hydrolase family 95 catalytic domain-containing protein [Chitinophaga barathri]|uniref:Trehalose hydrolase n=1 Tax=Chitinophaga barathri TaxID=1647451 RepID=A0A3N4MD22_9BACT|nr:trehalose hydrolase [Chitinophaga barathri]RPD41832.1 trehalose hydrolase [Chitinophaga barathri]
MKITALFACLLLANAAAAQDIYAGRYTSVFTAPPKEVPTAKVPDAPLSGNGDIGLTFGGTPGHLRLYFGKNDLWRAYPVYPGGGIALPGGLEIITPLMEGGSYYAEQRPQNAGIFSTFEKNNHKVEMNSWVTAMNNSVVMELSVNKPLDMQLKLWTPEGNTSVTAKGREGKVIWVTRSFENTPLLEWPCHVAIALNVNGAELSADNHITLQPGKKTTITVTLFTNQDRPDWKAAAIREAAGMNNEKLAGMAKDHAAWWRGFWDRSHVEIGDSVLERYYYNSQYLFAASSRPGKFAPGIWGPFITKDSTAWGGDYHLNYNYQGPYWAAYSSNYIDLTDNYDQPLLDYMDRGRVHAKQLLNKRGVYYPVGIGPKGLCTTRWPLTPTEMLARYGTTDNTIDSGYKFLGQKINAVFGAANMFMRFYSTYDMAYAKKVYPFLLANADFWEDYLEWENGRYVIKMDHFNEVMPNLRNKGQWKQMLGDYNSNLSLGLVKMLFKGMLEVSRFTGQDSSRREKWQHILTHLSRFPTGETDGRTALKNVEKSPVAGQMQPRGLARVSIHGLILPGEVCGPVTDSAFNAILLSDVSHWKDKMQAPGEWGNTLGNGLETSFPGAVRVGYDSDEIIRQLKDRIKLQTFPNGWITQAGGGIETLAAVPLTINEMLMQSYEGRVRIFPNWNHNRDAHFENLRAYGAFLVSSAVKNNEVQYVKVFSEKGRNCEMENPWPGRSVQLVRKNEVPVILSGKVLRISTKENDAFELLAVR